MLPAEKALVERRRSEPFVLLGINSDDDLVKFKKQSAEFGMTWRNAMEGSVRGPIATEWNVSGRPTIVLLDADGRIRARYGGDPGEKTLASMLDKLVAEAKSRAKPK